MRSRGQVSHMRRGQGRISDPRLRDDTEHGQLGILIFAHRLKLLHINRRALELIGLLDPAEIGTACEIDSAPVRELRNAIQVALDQRRAAHIWEPFELKRVLFEARRSILVRGLGLTDRSPDDDSRIVIMLEELSPREPCSESQRQVGGQS
ncbi:hypothetical protein YTPLAS72_12490 [Nitrospira sp.]|nr:hypothetical protein YTPLAS72_12490 [Nitrospira sp.]